MYYELCPSPKHLFITMFFSLFQDDAEFKKARGAELEYESLKVSDNDSVQSQKTYF